MEPLKKIFGRRLKVLRDSKDWTQEQLGQAADVDAKHVGAIERGDNTPSFEAIERLAKALKVDYYELFLPDAVLNSEPEQGLKVLIRDIEKHAPPQLKRFLRDILASASHYLSDTSK